MNWHRTGIILLFDLRYSLSGLKGLFFLMPYFLFWLWLLTKLDQPVSMWMQSWGFVLFAASFEFETAMELFVTHPPAMTMTASPGRDRPPRFAPYDLAASACTGSSAARSLSLPRRTP